MCRTSSLRDDINFLSESAKGGAAAAHWALTATARGHGWDAEPAPAGIAFFVLPRLARRLVMGGALPSGLTHVRFEKLLRVRSQAKLALAAW